MAQSPVAGLVTLAQFRKAYWNRELDHEVLKMDTNDVALNVLYIQVHASRPLCVPRTHTPQLANDMKAGHFSAPTELHAQLQALKKAGDRKGMLAVRVVLSRLCADPLPQAARTISGYGQLAFKPATFSYPQQGLKGSIAVICGAIKFLLDDGRELVFPVARIRCWKARVTVGPARTLPCPDSRDRRDI